MCALRAQGAVELEPRHVPLVLQATLFCEGYGLRDMWPQVEFELVEGMQQQYTSWTRYQVVCIVFKEIVQLEFYSIEIM